MTINNNLEHSIARHRYRESHGKNDPTNDRYGQIIVPDRNENPEDTLNTMGICGRINLEAFTRYGLKNKLIQTVCLPDQSDPIKAQEKKEGLKEIYAELKKEHQEADCLNLLPGFEYLRMHSEMRDTLLPICKDIPGLEVLTQRLNETAEIYGKGANIYLNGWAMNPGFLISFDAEDDFRNVRQGILFALNGVEMEYDFVKGNFQRFHRNRRTGLWERGGRVNAGTKGFFYMFSEAGLVQNFDYPCCGDQGFSIGEVKGKSGFFERLHIPMDYGIEAGVIFQGLSPLNSLNNNIPLLRGLRATQANIWGSDDAPIGGENHQRAREGIRKMAGQVVGAGLAVVGYENLSKQWPTMDSFMERFEELQWSALEAYKEAGKERYGGVIPISGAIADDELREICLDSVRKIAERLYENPEQEQERQRSQFLPPIKKTKRKIGKRKSKQITDAINQFRTTITV